MERREERRRRCNYSWFTTLWCMLSRTTKHGRKPGILLPSTTEEGGPPGLDLVPNTLITEEVGTGARVFYFTELPIRLLKEFRSSTGEFNLADMVNDYSEQEDMIDEANDELNKTYDYALDHGIMGCLPKKVKYTDTYEGVRKRRGSQGPAAPMKPHPAPSVEEFRHRRRNPS
jgi:hypothetical protein